LPLEFWDSLANLESFEVLVAERDASRSRSTSPTPAMFESVPPPPPRSPRETGQVDGWATETIFPTAGSEATAAATVPEQSFVPAFDTVEGAANTDFGSTAGFHVESPIDDGFGAAVIDTGLKELPSHDEFGLHTPMKKLGGSQKEVTLADDEHAVWDSTIKGDKIALDKEVERFHAVASADQAISQNLRVEVDGLDSELARLKEQFVELDQQVRHKQHDFRQLEQGRHGLERKLKERRQRIGALHEQSRKMDLESISLHRDRKHLAGEQAFLQQQTRDEEATVSALDRANKFLERSEREMEAHVELLERERRQVLREAGREKELVQAAERKNNELRGRLEKLQREVLLSVAERGNHGLRDSCIKPDLGRQGELILPNGGHTWAPVVATTGCTTAAGLVPADGAARMPLSTLLRSRQDV